MSSSEIEDVLSSIRRLVSEDMRPHRAADNRPAAVAPKQPDPADIPAANETKLLLTPALRVVPDDVQERTLRPHLVPEPLGAKRQMMASVREDAPRSEPPMILMPRAKLPSEPLGGAERAQGGLPPTLLRPFTEAPEAKRPVIRPPEPPAPAPQPEHHGEEAPFHADAEEERDDSLVRVVTSIGATLGARSAEWESETGDSGFVASEHLSAKWAEVDEADNVSTEAAKDADAAEETAEVEVDIWPEPEVEEERQDAPVEDYADSEADVQPEVLFSSKRRIDPGAEPLIEEIPDDWEASEAVRIAPEDDDLTAVLDEATLRELVREVIREELTGELGTRMTRNIRKLVRAELNRMLTAQDFE